MPKEFTFRVVKAENGFMLEAKHNLSGAASRIYVAKDIEELQESVIASMVMAELKVAADRDEIDDLVDDLAGLQVQRPAPPMMAKKGPMKKSEW